jgi:hypothetical protein
MKKVLVLTLAALFVFSTAVFAQDPVSGLSGKGIKLGLNLANVTGDDAPDGTSMRLGFAGGGWITYSFSDLFAIQPELLYSMKGTKYDDVSGDQVTFKADYIEIPVLFRVQLAGGGNFKPNFYAGPAVSFLLSAKAGDVDVKDDLKSTDFGLIGGAGADFHMGAGPGKVTFDVRYEVGLTSTDNVDDGYDAKINNSAISFLVGYGF